MISISPGAMSPVRDAPGGHLVQIGHAVRRKNPGAGSCTEHGDIPRFFVCNANQGLKNHVAAGGLKEGATNIFFR